VVKKKKYSMMKRTKLYNSIRNNSRLEDTGMEVPRKSEIAKVFGYRLFAVNKN